MKKLLKVLILNIMIMMCALAIAGTAHRVVLVVTPGCEYCSEAEKILDRSGIKYHTMVTRTGTVPRLYVDGQYKGTGLDSVKTWIGRNRN